MPTLLFVPVRVRGVPSPGRGHDGVDLGIAGGPAEVAHDRFGGGDEVRGVAGPARMLDGRDRPAGDASRGLEHLADACTLAGADVVGQPLAWLDPLQGAQ